MVCESGIDPRKADSTGFADPQPAGDGSLIRPIPAIRALYYCYYLI
jgi:hypothetical protein